MTTESVWLSISWPPLKSSKSTRSSSAISGHNSMSTSIKVMWFMMTMILTDKTMMERRACINLRTTLRKICNHQALALNSNHQSQSLEIFNQNRLLTQRIHLLWAPKCLLIIQSTRVWIWASIKTNSGSATSPTLLTLHSSRLNLCRTIRRITLQGVRSPSKVWCREVGATPRI